ncbi:MAG: hypothetical protein ACREJ2_03765 [Planctomycetota bacterium]
MQTPSSTGASAAEPAPSEAGGQPSVPVIQAATDIHLPLWLVILILWLVVGLQGILVAFRCSVFVHFIAGLVSFVPFFVYALLFLAMPLRRLCAFFLICLPIVGGMFFLPGWLAALLWVHPLPRESGPAMRIARAAAEFTCCLHAIILGLYGYRRWRLAVRAARDAMPTSITPPTIPTAASPPVPGDDDIEPSPPSQRADW